MYLHVVLTGKKPTKVTPSTPRRSTPTRPTPRRTTPRRTPTTRRTVTNRPTEGKGFCNHLYRKIDATMRSKFAQVIFSMMRRLYALTTKLKPENIFRTLNLKTQNSYPDSQTFSFFYESDHASPQPPTLSNSNQGLFPYYHLQSLFCHPFILARLPSFSHFPSFLQHTI